MKKYDIVIIGAATSGAYFAAKMAKKGFSVKMIERLSEEKLGTRMDIFHVSRTDLNTFDMPAVSQGDEAWAFEFTDNHFSSPSDKYSVPTTCETVGLHMHAYVALMVKKALDAGAEIEYNASFSGFILEDGKVAGVKYTHDGEEKELCAKVVVDCSGSAAVGRRALPDWSIVERFALTPDDMFYVLLRYVKFREEKINTFWLHAKSWYAPFSMDSHEKIIGTGATHSYARARETAAKLDKASLKGDYELVRTEVGTTPYRRPPYSLVDDNFIVTGDAGCLTKPDCGEGVTSSMVMMDIAADVLGKALERGDTSREALWDINVRYNQVQGADFCLVRAFLTRVIKAKDEELEYCFSKGIIFNSKFLDGGKINPLDIVSTLGGVMKGVGRKHISGKTIRQVLAGAALGIELKNHYLAYPDNPGALPVWCAKADKLWKKVGPVD